MRISAKSKYGLASMLYMAQNSAANSYITVQTLSDKLNISRIYLEQVFALLKRADLVVSAKGSQGGYQLSKRADKISVYDILYATESALFEETTVEGYDELRIENTLRKAVFDKLDENIEKLLEGIKLQDLLSELEKETGEEGYAYQI